MALNLIQKTIQRSIYKAIEAVLLSEGLIPDISLYSPITTQSQNDYNAAVQAIKNSKGFSVALFGHSNNQNKGLKDPPRIVINPRRIIPGDIGYDIYNPVYIRNASDPTQVQKAIPSFSTSNFQIEVNLVSNTSDQQVALNAILHQALGVRKFIRLYNTQELFLIYQYDYFEAPDSVEGVMEDIYAFQVDDLTLTEDELVNVSTIKEITLETTILAYNSSISPQGNPLGVYTEEDNLIIDLTGIKF